MARRRYRVAVKRSAVFGPAIALPSWAWAHLQEPGHLAGLAILGAASLMTVPALIVSALMIPLEIRQYAWVPRRYRISYRQKHGRDGARSSYIPDRMRQVTYSADRHRCVMRRWWRPRACQGGLQCDHRIPWAGGGATIPVNLFTLCRYHNGVKLNYSRDRDGYEHYAGNRNEENLAHARRILRAEKAASWNPLRRLRLAWALGA